MVATTVGGRAQPEVTPDAKVGQTKPTATMQDDGSREERGCIVETRGGGGGAVTVIVMLIVMWLWL